jgi:cysteinyl-tRNA synthetase
MSRKILGESIDIHGGGLDLMFPHHENELAQSESCSGKPFARYWLHNGLMQAGSQSGKVGGQHSREGDAIPDQESQVANKLAGSAGAESVKTAVFSKHHPETVRFFLLSTHYRSPIDFSDENIAKTGKSLDGFYRLFETFQRITEQDFYGLKDPNKRSESLPMEAKDADFAQEMNHLRALFLEAMDDDFNTGGAVGTLFEMRKAINGCIARQNLETGKPSASAIQDLTASMTMLKELANLLGVFRKPIEKAAGGDDEFVNGLMELIISLRAEARKTKNWSMADQIRNGLQALKVTLEDRPEKTLWRRD